MNRIWFAGVAVVVWQLCSMGFGFNEFMFGHPAPLAAILATTASALAWIALAVWSGYQRYFPFAITAALVWLAIVAVLLLAMVTIAVEGNGGVAPWHGAMLVLLIIAGGPLYSLGSLVPVGDELLGTLIVAALILASIAAAYAAGRGLSRRGRTGSSDNGESISEAH
jgi:hypothetical protein